MPKTTRLPKEFMPRKQNLRLGQREKVRRPRTKNFRTAVQFDKNRLKTTASLSKYRSGYKYAWQVPAAREVLKEHGFKAPGAWGHNQQGGYMFTMPYDIPASFDGDQAGWVMRHCAKSKRPRLTKSQLESVRVMLSYAFQLKTGKVSTKRFKANFAEVYDQWGSQDPHGYKPPTKRIKAEVSLDPQNLKTAFTTEWSADCGMCYHEWCVGNLMTWDWSVLGSRNGEGLKRIKQTEHHQVCPSQGWMRTDFKGGRPKLQNQARNTRPWKAYRVCLCPEAKHVPLPDGWDSYENLDEQCNPKNVTWCTVCPLNCFQVVNGSLHEEDARIYPRWCAVEKRYSLHNIGKPKMIDFCRRWIDAQGANPDGLVFDSNSGRKALGKWCSQLNIPYHESMQIHGDLWDIWKKYYQPDLRKDPGFTERKQSEEVDECCRALWKLARFFGRGRTTRDDPVDLTQNQRDRLTIALLRRLGQTSIVNEILDA